MHLYFEFHCTSEDNELGIASGHSDPPLSASGEREAEELGQRYAGKNIDAVYCSDLLRAAQTATIAFPQEEIPIHADARLRECDYGKMNGSLVREVHDDLLARVDFEYPDGESYRQAVERVGEAVEDIKERHEDETVVIIGHRATYYALEHLVKGKDLETMLAEEWKWMPEWHWEADVR
jgi:broad specificity phosphatase PhoE